MLKIVHLSDTHGMHDEIKVPECDIVIHSGDWSGYGTLEEAQRFLAWLNRLPAKYKVFIAGNHDKSVVANNSLFRAELAKYEGIYYLQDQAIDLNGKIIIYGTPWTPTFGRWSFMLDRESDKMREMLEKIPNDIDILVCHGPLFGVLDKTADGDLAGNEEMNDYVESIKPKVFLCGHIHEGYGQQKFKDTECYNGALLDERYHIKNVPHVILMEERKEDWKIRGFRGK